jgi:hypothetical protein
MSLEPTTSLYFDLSGMRIVLRGVPSDIREPFRNNWRKFEVAAFDDPLIDARISVAGPPVERRILSAKSMQGAIDLNRACFTMEEGRIEVLLDGSAQVTLAPAPPVKQFHAGVNLLIAALAWRLPLVGGALLHGAGIVLDERAFVLVGPPGSGKSTWTELAQSAGALMLSDDMMFVDASGPRVEVLSTPIRGQFPEPHGPGRWPLARVLFPVHGKPPRISAVPHLLAAARLVGNLPYLSDCPEEDRRVEDWVRLLLSKTEVADLTFDLDATFVECLRAIENRP